MSAQEKFRQIVAELGQRLCVRGFSGTCPTFYRRLDQGWTVINVQRSKWNTATSVQLTVNVGFARKILFEFDSEALPNRPTEPMCHWRCRIGELMPEQADVWFDVESRTVPAELIGEMVPALDRAVDFTLVPSASDLGLRDLVLREPAIGMCGSEHKIVLYKLYGPPEAFEKALGEWKSHYERHIRSNWAWELFLRRLDEFAANHAVSPGQSSRPESAT